MIFNTIPDNFFNPLSSKNKVIYSDCIFLLYKGMSSNLSFGVERDFVIDTITDYLDSDENLAFDEDVEASNNRDRASIILRRLVDCGWLNVETTNNYVQMVSFNDYAIEITQTLNNIMSNKKLEYEGYIITIYSLIKNQSVPNSGILVTQIYENTEKLIIGLKSLSSNIKKYIEDLTKHSTVKEIMEALLDDYRENIGDKAYHRLKTSDNVSKYRPFIVEKLKDFLNNDEFIEVASLKIGEIEEVDKEEAKIKVKNYIREVVEAFTNIDNIIEEIDKKNTQYQKSAINRAKFLLSNSEDLTGQIKSILEYVIDESKSDEMNLKGIYELDFIDELYKLYNQSFMDEASLREPIEGKLEFLPNEIETVNIDKNLREEKLKKMKSKIENSMSAKKIELEVLELLKDKTVIKASNIPITRNRDLIKIIYIRLYGNRINSKYKINNLNLQVIKEGFTFKDFEIWRK